MPASSAPIRLREPLDLLGAMPHLLGFVPSESVVVMCLDASNRTTLTARADLPLLDAGQAAHAAHAADAARFVDDVGDHVVRAGARSVAIVLYTDADASPQDLRARAVTAVSPLPRRMLVEQLARRFATRGCPVSVALLVSRGHFANYLCEQACCPTGGTVLPAALTPAAMHVAAETVLEGRVVHQDRAALESLVAFDVAGAGDSAIATFERTDHEMTTRWLTDGLPRSRRLTSALLACAVLQRLDPPDRPDGYESTWCRPRSELTRWTADGKLTMRGIARFVIGLHDKQARDVVATHGLDIPVAVLVDILCEMSRSTPDRYAAPVCTLVAWMSYLGGNGALANVALDRALACRPDYEMAHLIEHALRSQLSPAVIRDMLQNTRAQLDEVTADEARQRRSRNVGAATPRPRRPR